MMLRLITILFSVFLNTAFASFDCSKVSTVAAQQNCQLLDRAITLRYEALLNYLPETQKITLEKQQAAWLKTRLEQKNENDFVANMQNQNNSLTNQISQIILPQLNLIPTQPQKVADLLQQFPTALAQSWLAFIYAGNYLQGENPTEILEKNRANILLANDTVILEAYDKNAKELLDHPDQAKLMGLVITDIRMSYDAETSAKALTYPCFIKKAYPDDYISLIFYWGSSRDAQAPVDDCEVNDPYTTLPAYAKFRNLVAKMDAKQGDDDMRAMLPGDPSAGDPSYVFGSMRFPVENIVLSDNNTLHNFLLIGTPKDLEKLNTKNAENYLAKFAQNKELSTQYAEFLLVQSQLESQVTELLIQKFKLTQEEAGFLAKKIVLSLVGLNCQQLAFQYTYKLQGG